MARTTFFTCCNAAYEHYIPIFVHSILFHNDDVDVEVCMETVDPSTEFKKAMEYLSSKYPSAKIKLRTRPDFLHVKLGERTFGSCANVIRFIETPEIKNDYVYIADVDIITLERNISEKHIDNMKKLGTKYSNIVRQNLLPKRLSGLHFTEWDAYYPILDYFEMATRSLLSLDEVFLYEMVARRQEINETSTFRPIHGIHISPNRDPNEWIQTVAWNDAWKKFRLSDEFLFLEQLYSDKMKEMIRFIDKVCLLDFRTEGRFTNIYETNAWNSKESRSGPGSEVAHNTTLLENLKKFVSDHGVRTILDLGCGDFNWMQLFDFSMIDKYIGIDIVADEIAMNTKFFANEKIQFIHGNILNYDLPKVDLIISKDVLVHLDYSQAIAVLSNIKLSGSTYFAATTFTNVENKDIETGRWRPIDLTISPFNLGKPMLFYDNIEDYKTEWTNKGFGIWKLK